MEYLIFSLCGLTLFTCTVWYGPFSYTFFYISVFLNVLYVLLHIITSRTQRAWYTRIGLLIWLFGITSGENLFFIPWGRAMLQHVSLWITIFFGVTWYSQVTNSDLFRAKHDKPEV